MAILSFVRKLEGENNTKRKVALKRLLRSQRIPYSSHRYRTALSGHGENIIAELGPHSGHAIVLAAHYDTVPSSPGANDDASGCAVLIDVYKALQKKEKQLKKQLIFCWFDQEEPGYCYGSASWVKHKGIETIEAMLDLEMVGMGDTLAVWPIRGADAQFLKRIRKALKAANIRTEELDNLPMFWGDYIPFRNAGLRKSICFSVAPISQRKAIRDFVTKPALLTRIGLVFGTVKIPKYFEHYHSPIDQSKFLSEKALNLTKKAVISCVSALSQK